MESYMATFPVRPHAPEELPNTTFFLRSFTVAPPLGPTLAEVSSVRTLAKGQGCAIS